MIPRVLFVDDDSNVLAGVRNLLRRRRREWDLHFVTGGREALRAFAEQPFDVVVTDMRMPEMDGAALLAHLREDYPASARIILSGHADQDTTVRALPVAHQFLFKPCDPAVLEGTVEGACALPLLVADPEVRRAIGRLNRLPSPAGALRSLSRVLNDEEATPEMLAAVLKSDLGMCAKLLQIVNSAFYRLSRRIANVQEAVAYLGFGAVRHLAVDLQIFGQESEGTGEPAEPTEGQRHGQRVGQLAEAILAGRPEQAGAYASGLLHDVGKAVLAAVDPGRKAAGVTHANAGGYLLSLWGLPPCIVETALHHHEPAWTGSAGFGCLQAVRVANELVNGRNGVDAYAGRFGLADRVREWEALAAAQAAALSEAS